MYINKIKNYIIQYAHKDVLEKNKNGFINYKGNKLRTDFVVDFLNPFYMKYLRSESKKNVKMTLSSNILHKKYHTYTPYLKFLVDEKFIEKSCNYYPGERCNEYKIFTKRFEGDNFIEYKNYDSSIHKRLIAFYNNSSNFLKSDIIDEDILKFTAECLNHITIEKEKALSILEKIDNVNNNKRKLKINKYSINAIDHGSLWVTADRYGRIHSNFTILKKEIRNTLLIDGEETFELDIKNSQPLFLLEVVANNADLINTSPKDLPTYYSEVVAGNLYDYLIKNGFNKSRDEVKKYVFYALCGKCHRNIKLEKVFPTISSFIYDYKKLKKDYKILAQELQKIESNFIFNRVCRRLKDKGITYFTVHDSVNVKKSDIKVAKKIFYEELDKYKKELGQKIINI